MNYYIMDENGSSGSHIGRWIIIIVIIIIILIVIALVIWLIVRHKKQSSNSSPPQGNGNPGLPPGQSPQLPPSAPISPTPTCSSNSDCNTGQTCVDNFCINTMGSCTGNEQCAPGYQCKNGYCVPYCSTSKDCADQTNLCINNLCIANPTCGNVSSCGDIDGVNCGWCFDPAGSGFSGVAIPLTGPNALNSPQGPGCWQLAKTADQCPGVSTCSNVTSCSGISGTPCGWCTSVNVNDNGGGGIALLASPSGTSAQNPIYNPSTKSTLCNSANDWINTSSGCP